MSSVDRGHENMFVISAITPSRRRPGRFDVVFDDTPGVTLSLDAIERLELAVGRSVAGMESILEREATRLRIYDRALAMLALRSRSTRELSRALVRKGEDAEHVDHAIERLTTQGLLDDAAFAESFARSRVIGAKESRRRVQQGLAKRGIPRVVSDAAIDAVMRDEEVDAQAMVLEAARKKLRALATLEPGVRRRRLYGFLARRGHDADDIRRVMHELREELREG